MRGLLFTIVRVGLKLAGIRVLERKLGTCAYCHCGVWESDKRIQMHGAVYHSDCATYVRRGLA